MTVEEKQELLSQVAEEVKNLRLGSLYKTATQSVPGDGNPDADILFIGEAPGFFEDQKGKPFVGNAGKLLDKMLDSISLNREDIFITNIIKHRPPENRDPTPEEIKIYTPFLKRQIQIIQPKIIATLGRFSMNLFLPDEKISQAHGRSYQVGKYHLFPLYHPAAALRAGNILKELENDFQKLKIVLEQSKINDNPKLDAEISVIQEELL
ncbi:uracil-DNA glycosylase [Candidatus Curtissbacteria bacterium]|nr:uracil-DNA glycosylase [Candidatus Curtissbacteria bacterium]